VETWLQEKQPRCVPPPVFPLRSCRPLTDATDLVSNHHGCCSPASSLPPLSQRHPPTLTSICR